MTDDSRTYLDSNIGKDELVNLPKGLQQILNEHLEQYRTDPEAAHYWDPIVMGLPGGPVATLMISFVGRKSGKTLQTALQYFKLDGKVAVVASRGGSIEHPVWYLNLLDNPEIKVQIGVESFEARARTVQGEERKRWWKKVTEEQPIQIEYQSRTSREIPVVVLEGIDLP